MSRPRTGFHLLALALVLALSSPVLAQRGQGGGHGGRSGGSSERGSGGGKSSTIFGGAKSRLAPARARSTVDVRDIMRKVKELQVKSKAQAQDRPKKVIELADESQLRAWFEVCDHNRNGWVSFSEAAHSLRFTRGRFGIFDEDRDGRLVAGEFQDYYMRSIVSTGAFNRPRPKDSGGPPPPRTPEQLRAAYDTDLDGALGNLELAQLLLDYEQAAADPAALLLALDADGDGRLGLAELDGLHDLLYPALPELDVTPTEDGPGSVLELFGQVIPRPSLTGAPPSPPQVVGPVSQFDRLDIDRDGFISVKDLETLMRPVRIGVRPHAVVNTLDTDGDMRLSRAEFAAAMGLVEH